MSGILKRKFEEVDGSSPCSSVRESDDEVLSSESADSSDSVNPSTSSHFTPSSILKREKRLRTRNVHFENVTVYYFTRRQGFTSVPSQGGSTLGMSNRHNCVRQYTLGEFALEQERIHREMLRDHLKQEKLNSIKLKLTKNGTVESEEANTLTVDDISDDDIDVDNTEVDEYFFLQPLTTKKRRALLRASGVKKIDVEEKHELRAIRVSREDCGCDCRIFCDPETCACSMAGIKCQVDRMTFPCGCTKEGCSNTAGRIEFNPIRVRTHFLHTIMKLELEKNREQQQASTVNGYHGEVNVNSNPLVQAQHSLEYSLTDAVPQTALMHLQAAEELDEQGEEEEEDEDEEEEEEEEDDDDEDDDGSSLCSGITDSSTQSLAASDSDNDDDDDVDDDNDEDKSDDFGEGITKPAVSHTEVVPLSSVLCYSDSTMIHENRNETNSYYTNSSAEYYQIENPNTAAAAVNSVTNQANEAYNEASSYSERVTNNKGTMSLVPYNVTSEQYPDYTSQPEESYGNRQYPAANEVPSVIVCCSADQDNSVQCNGIYGEQTPGRSQMEFHNYLNNNSQDRYVANGSCFPAEQPKEILAGLCEGAALPESNNNIKKPAELDSVPEATPV
ncbi:cysteine/serine-rich nuclear protein 3-like [Acipenser oxyrinchus oxyrinchus]|uniref:Cysteine/serine-rich nuclear protein 3-like n=1 Tax=Acipenser oxyrinchus oxyrinchus TaxID=40147 RepID=A0AAD8G361_ACIOX|nr:cysteine/serine-rich nuclear protein 3-like [Acipenser oxyrinchus oxyrinchus]